MTTITRTLGALALTATGAAIMASAAQAHSVAVACVGDRVVATGSLFPVSPPVVSAQLTVDGVAGPVIPVGSIPGPNPRFTFPEPLYGAHTVIVSLINGGTWTSPATPVVCGPPPAQQPAEVPVVTPTPPLTCAEKIAMFPKAGPKTRAAWGCPIVRKPPVVERPPAKKKVTCALLRKVGAGPKAYARRGWYYRCKAPTPVRVDQPGVAG